MDAITISKTTARRFVLGRQGLWPGRRWAGLDGTAQALRYIEAVQMDPLNVVARSHDLVLWGRVQDYSPDHLTHLLYQQRSFFDYGGGLFIYPMAELPYWRLHMQRCACQPRWASFAAEHQEVLEAVKAELRTRGPLGNRDFTGNKRVYSYRGRKDTALALFYLWLTGELMIHHRQGFERVYDFRENLAPAELQWIASEGETEAFFARKAIAFLGLIRENGWRVSLADYLQRPVSRAEARQSLEKLLNAGAVVPVRVEAEKDLRYALGEDLPMITTLEAGEIPVQWQVSTSTTSQAVVLLAPLDIVSARGRASWLFDFEYVWEVYKPAAQRRWGYYTLPVLYRDRLVARLDPRLDRRTQTLHINGFWLEAHAPAREAAFVSALGRGLVSFAAFLNAQSINLAVVAPRDLQVGLQDEMRSAIQVQIESVTNGN